MVSKKQRRLSPLPALLLLTLSVYAYSRPSDSLYAFSIWPAWVWFVLGVLLSIKTHRRRLLVLAWLLFGVFFVEEFRSLPRSLLPKPESNLRVVSLNCAGGEPLAAKEVAAYRPDIVLLQESPGRDDVERLAMELYGSEGSSVVGPDAAILARGRLTPLALPKGTSDFVAADLSTGKGVDLRIVSLRFLPPTLRFDLWNPAAWQDYAANRRSRRLEVSEVAEALDDYGDWPDILGGDFNTPPDSGIAAPFTKHLRDSFRDSGRGYGATAVNPWPLVRIDQIWYGPRVSPACTFAHNTVNSDHRIVVADFSIPARPSQNALDER